MTVYQLVQDLHAMVHQFVKGVVPEVHPRAELGVVLSHRKRATRDRHLIAIFKRLVRVQEEVPKRVAEMRTRVVALIGAERAAVE